jgi:hypothetical protein
LGVKVCELDCQVVEFEEVRFSGLAAGQSGDEREIAGGAVDLPEQFGESV